MDMALKNKPLLAYSLIFGLLILILSACSAAAEVAPTPTTEPTPEPITEPTLEPTPEPAAEWELDGWTLIWQDEFDGETLDPSRWEMEIGGHGWGNNERQFYTDRPENVRLEDGQLIIEAREEFFVRRDYTSGRIKTQNLFSFTYGRVEAKMKLPFGQGIWPAFWMLGEDFDQIGWPACGEIDIMEHIGRQPRHIHGTVHGPGYSGGGGVGHFITFPEGVLYEEFHVYAIEWEPEEIRWYVNDQHFFTLRPAQVPGEWVFDKPFFLLLNLAVGGNWPGYPDETTIFPQFLIVDYVRVYQRPEMAEEFESLAGGVIHVGEISTALVEEDEGERLAVQITVIDADGQPVPDVRVTGGWVGPGASGETEGLTDQDGTLTLYSDANENLGEFTYCVSGLQRRGFRYDDSANARFCSPKID